MLSSSKKKPKSENQNKTENCQIFWNYRFNIFYHLFVLLCCVSPDGVYEDVKIVGWMNSSRVLLVFDDNLLLDHTSP